MPDKVSVAEATIRREAEDGSCLRVVHSFLIMDTSKGIIPYM